MSIVLKLVYGRQVWKGGSLSQEVISLFVSCKVNNALGGASWPLLLMIGAYSIPVYLLHIPNTLPELWQQVGSSGTLPSNLRLCVHSPSHRSRHQKLDDYRYSRLHPSTRHTASLLSSDISSSPYHLPPPPTVLCKVSSLARRR